VAFECVPVIPCRVSSCRLYGFRRPLPCGSPGDGLGTLPVIAHRCSPCDARGVAAALALTASSLALFSTRLPGRNGPSRSSAKHRCRPHCCEPAIDPLFGSTSELPSVALPGSRRTPLLGLDEGNRLTPAPSALRPSIDHPLRDASREVTVRVHSRMGSKLLILRLRDANPEVMFRPRGFAPPRRLSPRDGSRACCIPLPILGFVSFRALVVRRPAHFPRR